MNINKIKKYKSYLYTLLFLFILIIIFSISLFSCQNSENIKSMDNKEKIKLKVTTSPKIGSIPPTYKFRLFLNHSKLLYELITQTDKPKITHKGIFIKRNKMSNSLGFNLA